MLRSQSETLYELTDTSNEISQIYHTSHRSALKHTAQQTWVTGFHTYCSVYLMTTCIGLHVSASSLQPQMFGDSPELAETVGHL